MGERIMEWTVLGVLSLMLGRLGGGWKLGVCLTRRVKQSLTGV